VSDKEHPGRALIVARSMTYAARVEAALRALTGWRLDILSPAQLLEVARQSHDAVLILALGEAEARRTLRALRGRPAAVALSETPARFWTPAWRTLGVRGALPVHATPEELASAVRAVHAGLLAAHPEALSPPAAAAASAPGVALTSREREILELIAEGASNRRIAARLAISRHTVKFHVASLLDKLGARTRAEAVTLALRAGLLAV